ncbi:Methyltransferase-like protein [Hondaea fermentalgiana]|uniref:tRNA N(3)-methylcytidine methyltransferase n=1 Tax=Hondaea fermentalgiana TaxID=2315210 RepID=A0A2R5GBX0_9STRA|nr:Methyltransferase-like protein [Hondaea fermentalgiana]|eukprot:GBG27208.1 Methyltransferase-like protein [Hondaea fermentalgiana]
METAAAREQNPGAEETAAGDASARRVEYFDADFAWEDVAAARREKCIGDEAPPVLDEQDVALRTDEEKLAESWESFYAAHANKFFKSRSYLAKAFPALAKAGSDEDRPTATLGELGCGTGAAVLPLLKEIPQLVAQTVDVSPSAIEALQRGAAAAGLGPDRLTAGVCDIVRDPLPMAPGSLDFGLLVFTLSAISPTHHCRVLRALATALRPGGLMCFRDYGLFDMVQTRCKTRLGENWYIKQDGVQCYFFSVEYLEALFASLGPEVSMHRVECKYVTVRNVNRKTGQNIDRVFLNAVFQRAAPSDVSSPSPCDK